MKESFNHCESDCVRPLENVHLMQQIRGSGFQFAVMDPVVPHCYYAIPYSMGIRYASLSLPAFTWIYRVPRLPSFASSLALGYTDQMTLVQRLTTFVLQSLLMFHMRNETTTYVARLAPDLPAISSYQLLQQVSPIAKRRFIVFHGHNFLEIVGANATGLVALRRIQPLNAHHAHISIKSAPNCIFSIG